MRVQVHTGKDWSWDMKSVWFQEILIFSMFYITSYQESFIYDTKFIPVLNCFLIIFQITVLVLDEEIL